MRQSITVEALEADPFPIYARLREEAPVCFVPAVGLRLVTRWDDVQHVATHPEIFTAEVDASPLVRTLGVNVLTVDGADHARMRAGMDAPMRPRAVEGYAPGVIEPIAAPPPRRDRRPAPGAELMGTYCEPVSVLALGAVMGLGDLDADTLRRWFGDLATGGANFEQDPEKQAVADATSAEIDGRSRRRCSTGSSASPTTACSRTCWRADATAGRGALEPEADPARRDAGAGPRARDLLWALLTHPETLARVRADRGLLRPAVEEALRWHSPVGTQTRQVTQPVDARRASTSSRATRSRPCSPRPTATSATGRTPTATTSTAAAPTPRSGSAPTTAPGRRSPATRCACRSRCCSTASRRCGSTRTMRSSSSGWEFRAPTALHVLWD